MKRKGRPPSNAKLKKSRKEYYDEAFQTVKDNLYSSDFMKHHNWLKEYFPNDMEELFQLRLIVEPKTNTDNLLQLEESDAMIQSRASLLKGNSDFVDSFNENISSWVDEGIGDNILELLRLLSDKVIIMQRSKKEQVHTIMRKSIGLLMFPDLQVKDST